MSRGHDVDQLHGGATVHHHHILVLTTCCPNSSVCVTVFSLRQLMKRLKSLWTMQWWKSRQLLPNTNRELHSSILDFRQTVVHWCRMCLNEEGSMETTLSRLITRTNKKSHLLENFVQRFCDEHYPYH